MMNTLVGGGGGGGGGNDHLAATLCHTKERAAAFPLRKTNSISLASATAHSNAISHLHCHFSSPISRSARFKIKIHFSAFRTNFAK